GPHLAAGGEGHKGLGCAAIFLPVLFILWPDPAELDREGGVPITGAFSFGQSRKFRHQRPIRGWSRQRNNPADAKVICPLLERPAIARNKIPELDGVTWRRMEIIRQPLVDQDF